MKRLISILLVFLMILSMTSVVSAAIWPIDPLYTYVNSVYASLTIDTTWGIATCTGGVSAKTNHPVMVDVSLQKNTGTYWQTIQTWSATGDWDADISRSYAVYSGYQYRVLTTGYIYDNAGRILESASTTHTVNYPKK